MLFFYKMDQRIVKLTHELNSVEVIPSHSLIYSQIDEQRLNIALTHMQEIQEEWAVLKTLKDPRVSQHKSLPNVFNVETAEGNPKASAHNSPDYAFKSTFDD